MGEQQKINFDGIAAAIGFFKTHFKSQPGLEEIAASVHMSYHHFQRMFTEWAGTSPKQFLQYISVEYAKSLLSEKKNTLFDTEELRNRSKYQMVQGQ